MKKSRSSSPECSVGARKCKKTLHQNDHPHNKYVGTRHAVSGNKHYSRNTNYRKMTKKLPQRKSPRAKWLDYNEGEYFVTICTHNWIHYFGEIADGEIQLSQIGLFLTECLENTKIHQPHINILQYVVMPNHFHAIIDIEKTDTACRVPTCEERAVNGIQNYKRPLLGSLQSWGGTKNSLSLAVKFYSSSQP